MALRSPLYERARQAGARFVFRDGWEVPLSYGPVAAEIAACRSSAGIADRSYVGKLELRAPAPALAAAIADQTGAAPELDAAQHHLGTWWCLLGPEHALALSTRAAEGVPREELEQALAPAGGTVEDVTAAFAAIEVAGPRAADLLARAAGPPDAPPGMRPGGGFRPTSIAGVAVTLLRERDDGFLVVCEPSGAEAVWVALSEAGRPLRATHVGVDALERLDAAPARH